MPEIFSKDCKLKLIEYCSNQQGLEVLDDLKNKISALIQKVTIK